MKRKTFLLSLPLIGLAAKTLVQEPNEAALKFTSGNRLVLPPDAGTIEYDSEYLYFNSGGQMFKTPIYK